MNHTYPDKRSFAQTHMPASIFLSYAVVQATGRAGYTPDILVQTPASVQQACIG